jgi:hypothetical protein
MVFRTWGGYRKGAGRKQTKRRKSQPHRKRKELNPIHPVHVILRVAPDIRTLRKLHIYQAIRQATFAVLPRAPEFRICHVSIQGTHVHLLVEAVGEMQLARGMQAFQISAARRINRAISRRTGMLREGNVVVDRYHAEVIDNPRRARHALSYVLNNWRKHGEDRRAFARDWKIDPYSTAMAFRGWKEQPSSHWSAPESYERMAVVLPETWLLYGAWEVYDPISIYDIPSRPRASRLTVIRDGLVRNAVG